MEDEVNEIVPMRKKILNFIFNYGAMIVMVLSPIVLLPLLFVTHDKKVGACAFVALLMAIYWVLGVIPLAQTALIPIMLFPILGVLDTDATIQKYMTNTTMLFIGGMFFAIALEVSNTHLRIALKMLQVIGTSFKAVMLGFMLTTMFLSMWINNTACTAMMVPIAEAVLQELLMKTHPVSNKRELMEEDVTTYYRYKKVLLISVAYSANFGGVGTLTGTGPNLVLLGQIEELFPGSEEVTYMTWMLYNVPGMLLRVLLAYLFLWVNYILLDKKKRVETDEEKLNIQTMIDQHYEELGPISFRESGIIVAFSLVILLWLTRMPRFVPGWTALFPDDFNIKDSVPAMLVAFFLFVIPSQPKNLKSPPLLDFNVGMKRMPWSLILLFGGGFALAEGSKRSGLSDAITSELAKLNTLPPSVIMIIICLVVSMMTAFVSNVATASIIIPVAANLATVIRVNPLYFIIPTTVVSSFAFMLPAGTPPNAIVYEAAEMKPLDMIIPGAIMNLMGLATEFVLILTLGDLVFDIQKYPAWARNDTRFR